jgi:phi13 family phage major tail protein
MAQIGLQYLICAPITESPAKVSHADGIVMSYAIKADISIELNEAKLSADNRIVENIKEFKAGKLSLNGDHLSYQTLELILGHKIEKLESGDEVLIAKGDDDGKYVGVGFYATSIKDGVKKYRAIWLQKIKFGVPNENLETKGDDGIKFQTPTIEGTVLTDVFGVWKQEGYFETEARAVMWLNSKAGIKNPEPAPEPPEPPEPGDGGDTGDDD